MNLKNFIRLLKTSPLLIPILALVDTTLLLTDLLASLVTPVKLCPRTLLILRFDVLGDYILFRNFLKDIKNSKQFGSHRIVLVGNNALKTIAETFDSDLIDQFIWTDIYKLSTRPLYRFRFVRVLRQVGATTAFCPTYSRVLVLDDFMVWASGAKERIGCYSDHINIKIWEASMGDRLYTRLIDSGQEFIFEMERDRRIVEQFLQEIVSIPQLVLDRSKLPTVSLPDNFIIFALGAGQDFRVWPTERFAYVANKILTVFNNYHIVLTGAPSEKQYAINFLNMVLQQERVTNLTGELTLPEVLFVLTQAKVLLTNETGVVHLAALTQTLTLVVSQGKSLVRWHPYPEEFGIQIQHLYPKFVEQNRSNLQNIANLFNPESPYSISDIQKDRVVECLIQCLHNFK